MRRSIFQSCTGAVCAMTAFIGSVRAEGTLETLDIVFIMDGSGSIRSAGWDREKAFIEDYIDSARLVDSRMAIITFGSDVAVEHEFIDDQSDTTIKNVVNALSWMQGSSYTRDAIQQAKDLFAAQSPPINDRLIVLITDGNPYPSREQDPCTVDFIYAMALPRINTVVVGLGNDWNPARMACLLADEDRDMVEIASATSDFVDFNRFRVGGVGNGDSTGDLIVDLDDYWDFQRCLSHASWARCNPANFVGDDGVVDLADFAHFQRIFRAPPKDP